MTASPANFSTVPPAACDLGGHRVVEPLEPGARPLRVLLVGQRRRAGQVSEEDGGELPFVGHAQKSGLHLAAVFDALSDRLQSALGDLRGRGKLDEEAISRAMREIRLALLEADVNFEVVKDFVAQVRERAVGQDVLKSITPGPAGREDRPRRADGADGGGQLASSSSPVGRRP